MLRGNGVMRDGVKVERAGNFMQADGSQKFTSRWEVQMSTPHPPIPPEIPVVPTPQPEITPYEVPQPEIPPPSDPTIPPGPKEPEIVPEHTPLEAPPTPPAHTG